MIAAVVAVVAAAAFVPMPSSSFRVPSIHPRSDKPAEQPTSTSIFGPEDNVWGTGLNKVSAQRSMVFMLDSRPKMPIEQTREVAAEKQSVWQYAVALSAGAGVAMAATALAVICSHESMSYQLPGKEMAQLAGETASFCAIFFAIIRSYLKGYLKGGDAHTVLD